MERSLITEDDRRRVVRAYNEVLHTQYRYMGANMYWAGKVLEKATGVPVAVTTVHNALYWYKMHEGYVPPELTSLLAKVTSDLTRSNGVAIPYYLSESWEPGSPERFNGEDEPAPQPTPQPAPQPAPQPTPEVKAEAVKETKPMSNVTNDNATINLLGAVLADVLKSMDNGGLEDKLIAKAEASLDKYIAEKYGPITRKTTVVIGDKAKEVKGVVHEKFGEVLNFIANDEPVYLAGPAGTGKNFLVKQIAEVLGLDFYFSNAVTQEYKITGFTDANGNYQESQFYKAFTKGGIFMLDEMDASIPEVLVILNAAIANRYFDFPAPIGKVEAHKNFRVIAAGNTYGNGADYDYVGRSQLDAASMDRFGLVEINYDPRIEEAMANGNTELLGFCRAFRKAAKNAGIKTVVSYRAINRMAKLDAALKPSELLKSCLTKGLDKQDIRTIRDSLMGYGKYSDAVNSLI